MSDGTCPKCDEKVEQEHKLCPQCGTSLESLDSRVQRSSTFLHVLMGLVLLMAGGYIALTGFGFVKYAGGALPEYVILIAVGVAIAIIGFAQMFRRPYEAVQSALPVCPKCSAILQGWEEHCPQCEYPLSETVSHD